MLPPKTRVEDDAVPTGETLLRHDLGDENVAYAVRRASHDLACATGDHLEPPRTILYFVTYLFRGDFVMVVHSISYEVRVLFGRPSDPDSPRTFGTAG